MRLRLTINYEVTEAAPDAEEILEEIVAEEANIFVASVRRRLAEAGVRDISMEMSERAA